MEEDRKKLQMDHAKGLNMGLEHYPYEAASTDIGADAPLPEVFATLEFIDWAGCHLWF